MMPFVSSELRFNVSKPIFSNIYDCKFIADKYIYIYICRI